MTLLGAAAAVCLPIFMADSAQATPEWIGGSVLSEETPEPTPADDAPTADPENTSEVSPSPAPEPSSSGVPTPSTEPSEPTPTAEPAPGGVLPTSAPTPARRPETPPALASSKISSGTIWLAGAALLLGGIILAFVSRQGRRLSADGNEPTGRAIEKARPANEKDTLELLVALGEAMVDSSYPVNVVRRTLRQTAEANGVLSVEPLVFPTALMVSVGSESGVITGVASAGDGQLFLSQVDDLDEVITQTQQRSIEPAEAVERIRRIRLAPHPYSPLLRLTAGTVMSSTFAVLLGASWAGVGVAAVLGGIVTGVFLLGSGLAKTYQVLLIVGSSMGVSILVFLLVRTSLDSQILPALLAPLVFLLPGALLTIGVIELSTGQYMSGSARLAAGGMRLILLAVGIVTAAALVGIPSIELSSSTHPLGEWAPWIAVGLFGPAISIYQGAKVSSLRWIVPVLYIAYGAQVLGSVLLGGVLSAFIGAIVMTPAAVVASRLHGPATIVNFLPAFWLLVPGALGLKGVTTILDGNSTGISTIVAAVSTMVAITLGILLGLAITRRL